MITHRRRIAAALLLAVSAFAHTRQTEAAEPDELVVYGKKVSVELDRAAVRIDAASQRSAMSASLEALRARDEGAARVAAASERPRG